MENNWQQAFNQMITGLYVLTTCHEEKINGMIVSWATQISHDPPMIMIAVHPNRYSHRLIEKSNHFALHVVANTQAELIERMMGPDPEAKFSGLDWQAGETDCPLLNDCLAWFECRVTDKHNPGNHTLFIGQVVNAGLSAPGQPLCTHDFEGAYHGSS